MNHSDWEPKRLTQTVTGTQGNCWQTCCAMLLDVEPDLLPPQCEYDKFRVNENGGREWYGPGYNNVLQAYLFKHHGLAYHEIHNGETIYERLLVAPPGWHMMTGRTVRSDSLHGARHVVVGRYGSVWHDVHPSRAGLLEDLRWGFLAPIPPQWLPGWAQSLRCLCPACGPEGKPALEIP